MIPRLPARFVVLGFLSCTALAAAGVAAAAAAPAPKAQAAKAKQEKPKHAKAKHEKPKRAKTAKKPDAKPKGRIAAAPHKPAQAAVPFPRPAPAAAPAQPAGRASHFLASAVPMLITPGVAANSAFAPDERTPAPPAPAAYAPAAAPPTAADVEATKEAIALARRGKAAAAGERGEAVRDAAARKLIEWAILRSEDSGGSFSRFAAFARANPAWPSVGLIRRRAEGQLWNEKREPGAVFAFFSNQEPLSARGKLAMARAALVQGDRAAAQGYVRDAWRNDDFGAELEQDVLEAFGGLLSRADHKARMDVRLYDNDADTALRAAKRLGSTEVAIAQARIAVTRKAHNAGALLDAVPAAARSDAGYMFSRIQWLRRHDRIEEAAQLLLAAPRDSEVIHDTNEWWIERRLIARKLLDAGEPQAAYRIARDAARPEKENLAVEQLFTAGWIALRFVHDPAAAARHFRAIAEITRHPTSLARASYWLGRAAEAAGRGGEARGHYEAAAQHSAAYYGQLARARLGRHEIALRRPPAPSGAQRAALRHVDVVRALELIYATDNRDLAIPFVADLDRIDDAGTLALLAEVAARHNDARAMLMIGKSALARGYAFDHYAFPSAGIPKFATIGPGVDRSVVFAIARQESAFNPRALSKARAMGLMQVTPSTGRVIARKWGVVFSEKRLLTDPAYNAQMGAAEIGALVRDFDGNHVLAFAAYNAGRGRVKEWIERYGDPRRPDIDVVDWVERIPFTETRNYVQRVMENMQVYRARFGAQLAIEADMRGARQ